MGKYLFIAEKPSAMREFSMVYNKHKSVIDKMLGAEIEFTALRGHIFRNQEPKEYPEWDKKWGQLYESELPMIPSTWKLKPNAGAGDTIKALKAKLKEGFEGIIVGTDSDVEGYGIYYLVEQAMGLSKYKTLRFLETSMTEKDILKSFKDMTDFHTDPKHVNATNAFLVRSRIDWLLGMNMTVLLTHRFGELIKYGSVKAPTMLMIYNNCNKIDNYTETLSYGVKSIHPGPFESVLTNDDDNKDRSFEKKEDAEKLISTLNNHATVKTFVKKTVTHKAPKLYALSDLQVDASKPPYGYSPDKTLEIAQSLYETHKILSYPRTSGNYLSSGKVGDFNDMLDSIKDIPDIKSFVSAIKPADIARASTDSNIVNDKEVAKASHDALIPTGGKVDWNALTEEEKNVFLLVCKRFVAHFMPLFTEEKITMTLDNNGKPFKTNGRRTIENGFNDIFGKTTKDVIIPDYKTGDTVDITETVVYEKKSSPPARYSMGTIIDAMKNIGNQIEDTKLKLLMKESSGIGTEATRGEILKDLKSTGYISVSKNMIYITDAGKRYVENIRVTKPDGTFDYGIADPVQVAFWSSKNNEVRLGERTVDDVMDNFYKYLEKKILETKASGAPIKRAYGQTADTESLPPCPVCGGKILSGKFGYYCSNYKETKCPLSIPNEMAGKKIVDGQKKSLLAGKTLQMKGFKSKAGKSFDAPVSLNKTTGKLEFVFDAAKPKTPKRNN